MTSTTTCPTPAPDRELSPLEARALVVRRAYAYWRFTLATECPADPPHAPRGEPCHAVDGRPGTICVERAFAAARRAASHR